ncbi:prepilin peptidase [Oerskovia sp. Sa1BUA8]|uniref:Prepilin peptidase n=1 Tax=Oerskovia douganii TaxID=2762210 RepID=A0A9D5UBD8_9CELL|nr:A24 family peptidase [Oerskovia douganii]MBE7700951.1 prepilin peptidase [Oerskovia douganii]
MTSAGGGDRWTAADEDAARGVRAGGRSGGRAGRAWSRARAEVGPHRRTVLAVTSVAVPVAVAGTLAAGLPVGLAPATVHLAVVGSALAVIDARTHRLPDALVLPSYPVLALLLGAASFLAPDAGALVRALVGGLTLCCAYFAMALVPAGLGFGDVKLAGLLGAYLGWCGWPELAVGTFAAFVLGGTAAVALLATRRADRRTAIPFGPFMLVGALVGAVHGPGVLGEALLLG